MGDVKVQYSTLRSLEGFFHQPQMLIHQVYSRRPGPPPHTRCGSTIALRRACLRTCSPVVPPRSTTTRQHSLSVSLSLSAHLSSRTGDTSPLLPPPRKLCRWTAHGWRNCSTCITTTRVA
jgi:hypothetical protein